MRRLRTLVVLAVVLAAPAGSRGEEHDALGAPLDLDAVIAFARAHNPEIRAARDKWRAAQARPAQVGALPDPMVDVAYHNESFDRLTLGSTDFAWVRVGASQEVPFPGKLGLKQTVATREAEEMGEAFRRVELDVISRVKTNYAEYAHLDEQLDILHRNKTLLEKLARTAEAKYAVGQGIQQDVLQAHVALSLLIDRDTVLQQRWESQTAMLNALLDRPASASLGMAEHPVERTLTRSLDDLTAAASAHAPELKMADRRIAAGESSVALAYREYLPDFVLRADYVHKAALLPEWEVGVGVKVPLYFATKQRAGVDEAAAGLAESRSTRDNAAHNIAAEVKDLYARAQASQRLVTLYRTTVIPQAHLALDSATSAYEVAKVDFATLLNSFTMMLEYEMRYHEEQANLQKVLAELEAVVGAPLED